MTPNSERTRTFLAATNSFILVVFLTAAYPAYGQDGKPEAPPKPWQINGVNATFNDPDPQVWATAIQQEFFVQVLKAMGEAGATHAPEVAALLRDQDSDVRQAAAQALGAMGEAGAAHAPEVAALLRDQDWQARQAAAQALGAMGPVDVHSVLAILYVAYLDNAQAPTSRFLSHYLGGAAPGEDKDILIAWLGRPKSEPPLNHETGLKALKAFEQAWKFSGEFPELHHDLERKIGDVATGVNWDTEDRDLLEGLAAKLENSQSSLAPAVRGVATSLGVKSQFMTAGQVWLGHVVFWLVLIFVYPRSPQVQAMFFWNPWMRRILGLGYIGFALTWVPFLRRALFKPFQDSLLADANLSSFDPQAYFADSTVKKKGATDSQPIQKAIPTIKGQLVLEGESGLGKSMFLRDLVRRSRGLVVYLPAEKCSKGVMEAIQAKLQGPAKDAAFLRNLIYSGALDLCIDGLNEVTAETRAKISEFAQSYFKGNILMATQPLDWEPPPTAQIYVMQPLSSAQVEVFLVSRWDEVGDQASRSLPQYETACRNYLQEALKEDQPKREQESIRRILSNPMDLSVVANMLAKGEAPNIFNLQEQQYQVMAADFQRQHVNAAFPLPMFSEGVYRMRLEDQATIPEDEFFDALQCMKHHKMVMVRQSEDSQGNPTKAWHFRHDKIMEYFIVQTFLGGDNDRPEQHLGDARFSGVYFLLAILLPLAEAEILREKLIHYAADSKDHSVSDRFIQLLRPRKAA